MRALKAGKVANQFLKVKGLGWEIEAPGYGPCLSTLLEIFQLKSVSWS